jgi:hypothetical protein
MAICPECKKQSSLGWRKATLSPLISIPCKECEAELTVSWKHYLIALLPASVWFVIGYIYTEESSMEQYLVIASSIVIMTVCQMFFMPIEIASPKDPA